MALSLVGTASSGASSGYTVDLTAISMATGDIVVVASAFGSGSSSAPTVTGDNSGAYTGLGAAAYANDTWDTNFQMFYMVQGATLDTTLTVTRPNNASYGGATVVQVWRGVNTASPIDVTGTPATTTNSSRGDPPSVTPVTSGAVVIAAGAGMQTPSGTPFTVPAGMSNPVSYNGNGTTSDCGVWIASATWTSGAYDPPAWTGGTTSTSSSAAAQTIALKPAASAVTHATSGTLTGQLGSVAGTAAHIAVHGTSGSLTGQIGSITGTANRFRSFDASGALIGQIGSVSGTAARSTGAVSHATSGTLTGPGSTIVGSSNRFRAFAASGALTGQGSTVAGVSARVRVMSATGALVGQGSALTGSAARSHLFSAVGTLVGQIGSIAGAALRSNGPVTHPTTGSLSGPGTSVSGSAARFRAFSTSGVLVGASTHLAGSAARFRAHATTGDIIGSGSSISGVSARVPAPVTHSTSGALVALGAQLSGLAAIGALPGNDNGSGWEFMRKRRRHSR